MENTETKVCSKCGLEKPLSGYPFRKDRNNYISICKDCYRIIKKKQWETRGSLYNKNKRNKYVMNGDKIKSQWRHRRYLLKDRYNEKQRIKRNLIETKIEINIRNRVYATIKNKYKTSSSLYFLGCSVDECRKWLESKFLPGMSWDNYGRYGWHIDHIIPCAAFDLTKPEEQLKCFHYTNLQPLWAEDNLSKKDKIQVLTSEGVFLV